MTIDLDSTVCEVFDKARSRVPPTATPRCWAITRCSRRAPRHRRDPARALSRRVLPTPSAAAQRFVREVVGRVRRAGAHRRPDHALRLWLLVQPHHRCPRAHVKGLRAAPSPAHPGERAPRRSAPDSHREVFAHRLGAGGRGAPRHLATRVAIRRVIAEPREV